MNKQIKAACVNFLETLGDKATSDQVFVILAAVAEKQGLDLQAEQRGIRGTYIHFVKKLIRS